MTRFKAGDYAGVGGPVYSRGECEYCKTGEEQYCEKRILAYASLDDCCHRLKRFKKVADEPYRA